MKNKIISILTIMIMSLSLITVGYSQSCECYDDDLREDIISYYGLDYLEDDIVMDYVGNNQGIGYDIADVNSYGIVNNSYKFNQSSYIDITGVETSQDFTVSAWYNWSGDVINGETPYIIDSGNGDEFAISVGGNRELSVYDGNGWRLTQDSISNEWVNVVFTYDDSEEEGILYVNSEIVDVYEGTFQSIGQDVYVGRSFEDGTNRFIGDVDEIGIWNKTLSNNDVVELYERQNIYNQSGQYPFNSSTQDDEDVEEDGNMFNISLDDEFTQLFLLFLSFIGLIMIYLGYTLGGGLMLFIVGFMLMVSGFNFILSFIPIIIGVYGIFTHS